jgi:hypothetical protein
VVPELLALAIPVPSTSATTPPALLPLLVAVALPAICVRASRKLKFLALASPIVHVSKGMANASIVPGINRGRTAEGGLRQEAADVAAGIGRYGTAAAGASLRDECGAGIAAGIGRGGVATVHRLRQEAAGIAAGIGRGGVAAAAC